MGLAVFLDPVDYISGKISKKFRTIYNHRKVSDRRYTQVRNPRSTPVSSDETALRNRFAAVVRAVQLRKKNMSYVTTDLANFNAQKGTGYKTLYQYLWHLCADEYDQQNG